ncbi:hypothetical protein E2C01_092722 [Portunus trituberculatus]|uniref:Uncharacterized protein n=1 Tax=Portunus trituberculatus TaxID=210409 RepID=A0A5B7JW74_PORTR|nr:hypothetical protein [Portunus trituberculatus]
MKLPAFIRDASLGADMFVYIGNTRPTRSASCEKCSQSQTETQNAIGNTFQQYYLTHTQSWNTLTHSLVTGHPVRYLVLHIAQTRISVHAVLIQLRVIGKDISRCLLCPNLA